MGKGIRQQAPALLLAAVALFAALGGTVYAATQIDGKTIKPKSLPGNRIKPSSLAGNRLLPGTISGDRLAPDSISGAQIDPSTLGQVPSAARAEVAESARDAATALNAVNALDAERVNGHSAGCQPPARLFAGACWGAGSETAATAPAAALACANQGGELPAALALAAFAQQPGVTLASEGEWSGDLVSYSGPGVYAAATISASGQIGSAGSNATRKYRCVVPLVS